MGERRESSAATSLQELMRLEDERQADVRRAVLRRREADDEARREAERRADAAERAQRVAEDERARAEGERAREEAARHRAMEAAAIERERLTATSKARAEELELQRAHDATMQALRRDAEAVTLKRLLAVVAVSALVVLGAGVGLYVLQLKPASDRAYAAVVADLAARDGAVRELRARLDEASREGERASRELSLARLETARLTREKDDLKRACDARVTPSSGHAGASGSGGGKAHDKASAPCNPKDPMCFDLPK